MERKPAMKKEPHAAFSIPGQLTHVPDQAGVPCPGQLDALPCGRLA
jgi:hypothetical protein